MSTYTTLLDCVREHNSAFALRHTKEPEQQFLKRFLTELADVSEDSFDQLPKECQDWFNHAVNDELNQHKEVTPPEGFADGPSADSGPRRTTRAQPTNGANEMSEATQEANGESQDEKPKRKRAARVPKEPKEPSARRPAFGGSAGRGVRKDFSVRSIRTMVIKNPEVTVDELMTAASQHGENFTESTIVLARAQALEMIAAAKEAGHWQG